MGGNKDFEGVFLFKKGYFLVSGYFGEDLFFYKYGGGNEVDHDFFFSLNFFLLFLG